MKPDSCSSYVNHTPECNSSSNGSYENTRVRVIKLRRHNNVPLGFSVRGGLEHGTGIFVSEIQPGTEAYRQGLLVGDQILRINGFNIEYAIHEEVLALLRSKPGVVIKVKSMGMIPVKDSRKDPLTWRIIEKGHSTADAIESKLEHPCFSNAKSYKEIKITIPAIGSKGLGCSIVKGPPEFPGIYIQSVKTGSLAEQAGLQVGDRIMEMNGRNFNKLDFADAVAVLKSSKEMSLILCKGLGLDLFREEKQSTELRDSFKTHETKRLSQVQEEDIRQERRAKKTTEQTSRVKNGFNKKQPMAATDKGNKSNERSSHVETDTSAKERNGDTNDKVISNRHNIQVSASVHAASYDVPDTNCLERCTRESGDGMDHESINKNEVLANVGGLSRPDGLQRNQDRLLDSQQTSSVSERLDPQKLCPNLVELGSDKLMAFNSRLQNGNRHSYHAGISAQRGSSTASDEISERSSISSDDYSGMTRHVKSECPRPQNEFLKKKQHELLMEEFREVHKKMFGQDIHRIPKQSEHVKNGVQDRTKYRQQVRSEKSVPPPPIDMTLTESLPRCLFHPDSDEDFSTERVTYRRRQREPPNNISLCPELVPPIPHQEKLYTEKSENESKPLVKIGPYPNHIQQNRFLLSEKDKQALDQKAKLVFVNTKDILPNSTEAKNVSNFSSSSSSTVPSSSSSEPHSPTTESVTSSDSIFQQSPAVISQLQTVPNMTVSEFSKHFEQSLNFKKKENQPDDKKSFSSSCLARRLNVKMRDKDSCKDIIVVDEEEELKDKEVKSIVLKKNGPLNFRIEGGINSDPDGKILVSELWNGSCTTTGGTIEIGDQILKVDNTKLTGLSLTAANVALRNANSNANTEMLLTIARLTK